MGPQIRVNILMMIFKFNSGALKSVAKLAGNEKQRCASKDKPKKSTFF